MATPSISITSSPVCRTLQINGKQHSLCRAVDQVGEVIDMYLQRKRDGAAAKRFFKRLLRSYGVGHRELIPEHIVPDGVGRLLENQDHITPL